jgi:hypothetical protein
MAAVRTASIQHICARFHNVKLGLVLLRQQYPAFMLSRLAQGILPLATNLEI